MGRPEPCWWCGAESTRLCDAPIGCERRADGTVITSEAYTCDAPLCVRCTKQVGHVCKRGRGRCCDSIDMCPEHAARGLNRSVADLVVGSVEAARVRREVQAKARRSRMRVVDPDGHR